VATISSLQGLGRPRLAGHEEASTQHSVDLSSFPHTYQVGRSRLTVLVWYFLNAIVFNTALVPMSGIKRRLLRLFGAKVGKGVVIKPRVNIKYPWNVSIGDHSWIGEGAWLDSLGKISIGSNVCVSQDVYLCTGSHDWSRPTFDLIVKPITLEDGVWLGCRTQVMGGVTMASHSILAAGSTISKSTEPYVIYRGNPAEPVKVREIEPAEEQPQPQPARKPAARGYRLVFPDAKPAASQPAGNLALASSSV